MNKKLDLALKRLEAHRSKLYSKLKEKKQEEEKFIKLYHAQIAKVIMPACKKLAVYLTKKGYRVKVDSDSVGDVEEVYLQISSETDYFGFTITKQSENKARIEWSYDVEYMSSGKGGETMPFSILTENYIFNIVAAIISAATDRSISSIIATTDIRQSEFK